MINNKISIVGNGNVGSHLIQAFDDNGIEITHVFSTSATIEDFSSLKSDVQIVHSVSELPANQLVLLCVPDDKIQSLVAQLDKSTPVAYTSGSVDLASFDRKNVGVFYPLQTFTKGKNLNIFEVPFFIESKDEAFAKQLFNLAWKLSRKVEYANSATRKKLHLAAVFVNNFTNHINHIAKKYLDANELEYQLLLPLLQETTQKLLEKTPFEAQTGPAKRKDYSIIEKHVEALKGTDQEIYRVITQSILNTYQND